MEQEKSMGPMIGIIVIIIILAIGGYYIWRQTSDKMFEENTNAAVVNLSTQGTSDDPDAIEADFNATNLDSLDRGI